MDPSTPYGGGKIAQAFLALRNYGGGFLMIGFDDSTMLPIATGRPTDVRALFHADVIQAIVSKYASDPFEVTVHFPEREGLEFPVIEVPSGVRTPVAAKIEFRDDKGRVRIRKDAVLVRSLNSNGVASSTDAGAKDWHQLLETCFDNREADIGRFLRRHLAGLEAGQLHAVLSTVTPPAAPTLLDRLSAVLNNGLTRFRSVSTERAQALPTHGWWEIAAIVQGLTTTWPANLDFRDRLLSSNPSLTGWPAWIDSRHFAKDSRPYLSEDTTAWEALIKQSNSTPGRLDFWRLSPPAEFYLYRAYEDDVSGHRGSPTPLTVLDFGLPVFRVAEVFAVGQAFASALGAPRDSASIGFAFRWNALKDRELSTWANPDRMVLPGRRSYRDVVTSFVELPLDTPNSALHTFVDKATQPLFEAFDGFRLEGSIIEQLVKKIIERRW